MDVSHILLGRPWLYDHDVTIQGRANNHIFKHEGKTILLRPVKLEPKAKGPAPTKGSTSKPINLHLLTEKQFIEESREVDVILAVVSKVLSPPTPTPDSLPKEVTQLLDEFKDVTPEELPPDLPPMRNIQHAIDLVQDHSSPAFHTIG
ncbi:uncharacterized protein LOC114737614 [Neltuma alba]|uniref:uncharacterized protein LOC114737614 n=1 Tax=Neltuma alba TaxID=207710 RepID=UPI0010A51769|nr:uncharacterized protein LOC114737614 [Prosopis alba]